MVEAGVRKPPPADGGGAIDRGDSTYTPDLGDDNDESTGNGGDRVHGQPPRPPVAGPRERGESPRQPGGDLPRRAGGPGGEDTPGEHHRPRPGRGDGQGLRGGLPPGGGLPPA